MKKILLIFLLILFYQYSYSSIVTAVADGDWQDPATWSTHYVPNHHDSVSIPYGFTVTNSGTAICSYLTVDGMFINYRTLDLYGDFYVTTNGSFDPQNGDVEFLANTLQYFGGIHSIDFWNLINANTTGIKSTSDVKIFNNFTMKDSSVYNTGSNQLVLVSSSLDQTGRITHLPNNWTIVGDVTQERIMKPAGWHMVSTFITTPQWNLYKYSEPISGDLNQGYSTGMISPGDGAFVKVLSPDTLLTASGGFFWGTFFTTLSLTGTDTLNDGWNLVGNPYPCEISCESAFSMINTTGVVYVWDPNSASYLWWVPMTGGTYQETIASGQSFWVQCVGSSGTLKITEDAKVESNKPFFRTQNPNENLIDIMVREYHDTLQHHTKIRVGNYTNCYQIGEDARWLESGTAKVPQVFTKSDDNWQLSLDSRKLPEISGDTLTISIWVQPAHIGMQYIEFTNLSLLPSGYHYKIIHSPTGQSQNWTNTAFPATTLTKTKYFDLLIWKEEEEPLLSTKESLSISSNLRLLTVFNLQGQQVDPNTLSSGVFIFQYDSPNGIINKKKIIIN